jgi:acylglycerol lipase
MSLFACTWLPGKRRTPKALVFLCHGYAVECGVTMRGTGERLARAGYAVYGMDYEGHGRSDGLQGYVPDFELLVRDCDDYFSSVVRRSQSQSKDDSKRFLLGESMGGAVALLLHLRRPEFWSGAVLVAPMCKIADDMRPHPLVVNILRAMTSIIPTWKIVPSNDVIDAGEEGRDPGQPLLLQGQAATQDRIRAAQGQLGPRAEPLHQVRFIFPCLQSPFLFLSIAVQID